MKNEEITTVKTTEKIIDLNRKIHVIWTRYRHVLPKERYKREHQLGRELLKKALKSDYEIKFEEQMLAFNIYAKPYLRDYPDIHFNISHSNSIVILALSDKEVGIDVEDIYHFSSAMIERVFTDEERKQARLYKNQDEYFTRLWTLKESYLKYTGAGLKFPLTDTTFLLETKAYPLKFVKGNEYFFQEKIGEESIFSLCTSKQ